jgi:hypothetical protein
MRGTAATRQDPAFPARLSLSLPQHNPPQNPQRERNQEGGLALAIFVSVSASMDRNATESGASGLSS